MLKYLFLFFLFCSQSVFCISLVEKKIVIVVCSYNNSKYYQWNLDSLLNQEYGNYAVIYVDDCSSDGTADLVKEYLQEHDVFNRVNLIVNKTRQKALQNLYDSIHTCNNTDIVVIVDGDDRLFDNKVLSYINSVYQDPNVWLTYGQFIEYPSKEVGFCKQYPKDVIEKKRFRYYTHSPSHLRTFYAGLFKKIHKEDLMFQDEFFPICYDLAIMFPMLEMTGGRFKFIPDVLLEYNSENPINDHKVAKNLQRKFDLIIRARTVYQTISTPFNDFCLCCGQNTPVF